MNWLKSNWKTLIQILAPILTAVGAAIGVVLIINPENVTIIVPLDNEPQVVQTTNVYGARDHRPLLMAIARSKAAQRMGGEAEYKSLSYMERLQLTRVVPDSEIVAEMTKRGVSLDGAPVGGPLKDFLEWLANNPDKVQKIIEIILMLIPLFA